VDISDNPKKYENLFKRYPKNCISRDIALVVKGKTEEAILDGGDTYGLPDRMPREYSS
jgi:hypothetical protein